MSPLASFHVRTASPNDTDAVRYLLTASYSLLLTDGYDAEVLDRALPFITKPNPTLLASGTWYVAEGTDAPGVLVGCGGWTRERPGAPQASVNPTFAYLRHFATHPGFTRRGVGKALFEQCLTDARRLGVKTLECHSSVVAEPFYRSLGFERIEPMTIRFSEDLSFPGICMICSIHKVPA
jgi:GNAT superfamily N-acetyltransferase